MLYEQDRDALGADAGKRSMKPAVSVGFMPETGSSRRSSLGLGSQRYRHFEQPQLAIGQGGSRSARAIQFPRTQHLLAFWTSRLSSRADRRQAQKDGERLLRDAMQADQHVVVHGRPANTLVFWNVRTTPSAAIRLGFSRLSGVPR